MAVYSVYEPPRRTADPLVHGGRFMFVRDRFSWFAFLLSPVWMLWHRMWLTLVLYLIVVAGLGAGLRAIGIPPVVVFLVEALVSLLIGFEASSLRRASLQRRGWRNLGVVVGDDLEAAERRFFDEWVRTAEPPRPPHPSASQVRSAAAPSRDVIGLFPEPGRPT